MKTSHYLATGLVLLSLNLQAQTTWYMTPSGTGSRNGTSWSNAFAGSNSDFTNVITNTMQPGDTLMIGGSTQAPTLRAVPAGSTEQFLLPPESQTYTSRVFALGSAASGTPSAPKSLIGVDRGHGHPVFLGVAEEPSAKAIDLVQNCSHLTIKNLDIKRYRVAIAVTGSAHTNLKFENINPHWITENGFYFVNASDVELRNCTVTRYKGSGFWTRHNCTDVKFFDCVADATQGDAAWISETSSPIGFRFHQKNWPEPFNTNILLEGCTARNNLGLTPPEYTQGDGFMVEGGNDGITLRKCLSDTSTDAGYDLKGINQLIEDSVAVNNKKSGVKVWFQGTFNNFASVNNGIQLLLAESGTFVQSGSIVVNNSTLHCSGTQKNIFVNRPNRTSAFNDCLFTFSGSANNGLFMVLAAGGGNAPVFTPSGTGAQMGRYTYTATTTLPPRYHNPVIPWNGLGTNYDNQTFGTAKGYNSTVTTTPSVPDGRTISINVAATGTLSLAPTDVAGAVPASHWNNSTANNELLTLLVDGNGAAVAGATALFGNTPFVYSNTTPNLAPPLDDDAKMMRSHRAGSNTANTSATLNGLPYATYDVYVYWGGRSSGQSVPATMTVELQLLSSGTFATQQTRFIKDGDRAWDGTYNESTATTSAAAVDGNEYVVFRNLTTPEFRIRTTAATRIGLSGLQIVEH